MVYCTKCGAKNPDDAVVCAQCGASLETETYISLDTNADKKNASDSLGGGAIVGIIVGLIIILAGVSWLLGFSFWKIFWPLIVIIFGILVLAGSLYGLRRKRLFTCEIHTRSRYKRNKSSCDPTE